jgi:glycerol-3-phosphate dehydrogenase (NAD(P)+)
MKIAILGSGSWGITLGLHLEKAGHEVSLWASSESKGKQLNEKRENSKILPGIKLPQNIFISSDISEVVNGKNGIIMAVPSHVLRNVSLRAAACWPKNAWALCASKGLEETTHFRMSQILFEVLPIGTKVAVLSGPSHAEEVSRQMPTTLVVASNDVFLAKTMQEIFHTDYLRVYTATDVIGVELGGALKNVIAIAAGILDGLGLGDNTKAALMTRGLHEMTRLGLALGAKEKTFAGLAGIGDLIVTCISRHSRNRLLGEKIGSGETLSQALKEMVMVAEGVRTAKSVVELARQVGVEVPIIEEVCNVLFENKSAKEAIVTLLTRSAKSEFDRNSDL